MHIRPETQPDHAAIAALITCAFASAPHADGNEAELVAALRTGDAYLPPLSLVAEEDGQIVGHILFTRAMVGDVAVLALAPLSVLPARQKQGIGRALIAEGHRVAAALGFPYAVVLGSEAYYPQSGYLPAAELGIRPPFDVPAANFMACRLTADAPALCGVLRYAKEFGIA